MQDTLMFIMAGSEVSRYHTCFTLQRESVGQHSHQVAMICLLINPLASRQLLLAALMHDLAECETGDIPSPAKRRYGIGEQVAELERDILKSAGVIYPQLSAEEERTLKLADIAQGALFCAGEVRRGNSGLRAVFDRYISYADAMLPLGRERELFQILKGLV